MRTLAGMSKTERALDEALDDSYDVSHDLDADLAEAELAVDEPSEEQSAAPSAEEPGVEEPGVEEPGVEEPGVEPYELPAIVMATEADDDAVEPGGDPLLARHTADEPSGLEPGPDVSDDVLDELRRADIDGPIVAPAPQDDTSSGIRRPSRAPDYDPAPFPIPVTVPRMLGRKPRVRRVTRVVRHVDPWTVFKIALVANLVMYLIVLTASVLLWNVAYATGTVDNLERFFESFGWSSFEFNGGQIYHSAWIGGLFLVIGFTGLAVLFATLFNLITDLVGGMRFTVLEEEVVEARSSPMRRFVVRRAEPEVPVVMHDESGPIVRDAVVDDSGSLPR
jgi:Transmembrane domain of unknown function (DUF3566)